MLDTIRREFRHHFFSCLKCEFSNECDRLSPYRAEGLGPQPGFIGKNYNGLVFLGGNPSAGGKDYHKAQEAEVYRLFRKFRASGQETDFEKIMGYLAQIMPSWYVMGGSLSDISRLGTHLQDIAYINVFKCPTQKNGGNYAVHNQPDKMRVCFQNHTIKQLEILKPKTIILLWKPLLQSLNDLGYNLDSANYDYWNGARSLSTNERHERLKSIRTAISNHYESQNGNTSKSHKLRKRQM